jgi:hypothetical protein
MLSYNIGQVTPGHVDHFNCRTKPKMDDLWECLSERSVRCPDQVAYGPQKYCLHKDHVGFGFKNRGPRK